MMFRKIATNLRVDSTSAGAAQSYTLDARSGGRMMKNAQYAIVIKQKSGANAMLGVALEHGPDGQHFILHSSPIATTGVNTSELLIGDTTGAGSMLNEWLRPSIICDSNDANPQWVLIDVYEMWKPF